MPTSQRDTGHGGDWLRSDPLFAPHRRTRRAALAAGKEVDMFVETSRSTAGIVIKHISAPPEPGDGKRILVNRLWPRSARKEKAALNEWHPEWAPSWPLRTWFAFRDERWDEFCRRYQLELETRGKLAELKVLAEAAKSQRVTLVFTGSDPVHNVAAALRRIIAES